MTQKPILVKIIPPGGYSIYRFRLTRLHFIVAAAVASIIFLTALGMHSYQLFIAERHVRDLQSLTAQQREKLRSIDRQADALANQLRTLQRQNDEIRRLIGAPAAHAGDRPTHARVAVPVSPDAVAARLAHMARVERATTLDARRLRRLTMHVLNLRRIAIITRVRMLAAIPSLNPVGGGIASAFGYRTSPFPEFHRGLDLEADYGTPVHASAVGTVVSAGWDGGFGIKVDIDHGNGFHTWYAHLSHVDVTPGQRVERGQQIALVGATGEATGPHLHYQVMHYGEAIDPSPFLDGVPANVLATLPGVSRVQ